MVHLVVSDTLLGPCVVGSGLLVSVCTTGWFVGAGGVGA